MEQATYQICREIPSLLLLNDDCLREIFKFQQLQDFVNLAVTCSRLLCVAQQIKKYKNIEVTKEYNSFCTPHEFSCKVKEFSKIVAVIGRNVVSIDVGRGVFAILYKTIADTDSGIAELLRYYSGQLDGQLEGCRSNPFGLLPFCNLKELKFGSYNVLSTDDWRHCFENNPEIENLELQYDNLNCLSLLKMLPKLKSLTINSLLLNLEDFHHLTYLTNLTKFSFWSVRTYNRLLIELAEKLNLLELAFRVPCDADTFAIVKSFRHLEVLSVDNWINELGVPETTIFPAMLKKIKLDRFTAISCSLFLSMVRQMKLLEEFDIGDRGTIFWDSDDEYEYFPKRPCRSGNMQGLKIISRIAEELRVEKRKLKIIFDDCSSIYNVVCKYSDNLEIINPQYVKKIFDHTFHLPTATC